MPGMRRSSLLWLPIGIPFVAQAQTLYRITNAIITEKDHVIRGMDATAMIHGADGSDRVVLHDAGGVELRAKGMVSPQHVRRSSVKHRAVHTTLEIELTVDGRKDAQRVENIHYLDQARRSHFKEQFTFKNGNRVSVVLAEFDGYPERSPKEEAGMAPSPDAGGGHLTRSRKAAPAKPSYRSSVRHMDRPVIFDRQQPPIMLIRSFHPMLKTLSFCLLFLLHVGIARGQDKAPQMIIGVEPVRTVDEPEYKYMAQQLTDLITRTLQRTGQFQVISNANAAVTKQERERQKSADYAGGHTADQFVVTGASKLLVGKLTGYEKAKKDEPVKLLNGETKMVNNTYMAAIFSLELVDVATNTSMSQEEFRVGAMNAHEGTAYDILMRNSSRRISNWLVKNLDHDFRIIQVESTTKKEGYPKTVLINGGTNLDLQNGEQLQVMEIQQIGTATREIPICGLTVQSVQGEVAVCTVGSILSKEDKQKLHERMEAKADLKVWFRSND